MKALLKTIYRTIFDLRKKKKNILFSQIAKETQGLTLLDLGAAGNIEPRWKVISPYLDYIGVEPDKRSNKLLDNKFNCRNYYVVDSIAWDKEEEVNFYLCKKPEVSSILKPNRDFLDKFPDSKRFNIEKKEFTKTKILDKSLPPKEIDFIKLDIQGAELNALKGMPNKLRNCLGLEIEVEFSELYINQPLFGDLDDFLKSNGFEFIDFTSLFRWERFKHNNYGQCIFGDGLWLRSPEYVVKNMPNKYSEYILATAIYGRYDLALKTIDILKPDIEIKLKNKLKKLIKIQRQTRNITRKLNSIIKFFNSEESTKLHLLY